MCREIYRFSESGVSVLVIPPVLDKTGGARRDAPVSDDPSPRGGAWAVPWAVLGLGGRERTICTVHQTLKAGERRAGF